ncbi:hypothetical protein RVR34_22985 [Microcystis aeruginosa FBCC-A68]|nr:hypothetical protein MAN88_33210 [Microcystis aeruginosa]
MPPYRTIPSNEEPKSLTEIAVSHSQQQPLVHRYHFEELPSNTEFKEMSRDGGKIRVRTPRSLNLA